MLLHKLLFTLVVSPLVFPANCGNTSGDTTSVKSSLCNNITEHCNQRSNKKSHKGSMGSPHAMFGQVQAFSFVWNCTCSNLKTNHNTDCGKECTPTATSCQSHCPWRTKDAKDRKTSYNQSLEQIIVG